MTSSGILIGPFPFGTFKEVEHNECRLLERTVGLSWGDVHGSGGLQSNGLVEVLNRHCLSTLSCDICKFCLISLNVGKKWFSLQLPSLAQP